MANIPSATTTTSLSFPFRGRNVPVTVASSVPMEHATKAIQSKLFVTWYQRCERRRSHQQPQQSEVHATMTTATKIPDSDGSEGSHMEIHSVEIQSVDMFGARGVGFIKIKSHCTLVDDASGEILATLPGICFLRGNAVTILVTLFVDDDEDQHPQPYALLVEQPRVPIGQLACLELPAGMIDDDHQSVTGIAVQEIKEECGIDIHPSTLVDLTDLALSTPVQRGHLPQAAVPHSPGGCDEFCRYFYVEKRVTVQELDEMRGRLQGLREHGEHIVLRVVSLQDVWQISGDAKAMIALFLVDQLRRQGRLAPAGGLATPLTPEPTLLLPNNGRPIPQLAFGLYKVPATVQGEDIILNAIRAGYRHFDGAAFYQNEKTLGRALRKSGLPRQAFFITSKVWNDAVKEGPDAVRASVQKSVADIDFGDYLDLCLIHWPVPGHYVEAYQALEEECRAGRVRSLGLSNFDEKEYEALMASDITVRPVCNQIEVSPVMFRATEIEYFAKQNIVVSAYKPLNRAAALDCPTIVDIAALYNKTPAQVMLRWGYQKKLVIASKTCSLARMEENRNILDFELSDAHMKMLDALTTNEALEKRREHELMRKTSL